VLFGVGALHVPRPNNASTLKKGQVNVFSLVFVSADNSIFRDLTFFFDKSVSALTLGGVALTKTNEDLLGRIYFRGVGCF